ncbi:MAG TPA: peptidase C69 [Lachnospiraceae bacterium]|nr:peptidase C69 [Lachnospiraceae bacterium]
MLCENIVSDILSAAVSGGAGFAEVFEEKTVKDSLSLINGKTDSALSGVEAGVGIRIIEGEKVVYVYTNKTDRESLLKLAQNGAQMLKGINKPGAYSFDKTDYSLKTLYPAEILPSEVKKEEIAAILKTGSDTAFKYDKRITQTSFSYLASTQNVLIANTEGLWATDERTRTRVFINAVASDEREKQNGYFGPGAMKGFEFLRNLDIVGLSNEAARVAVTMLTAGACPSGRFPVIIDNGFGGVIFHEACGHGLEAAAVSKGASVFAGKIGKQIANPKVSAYDDGTIVNAWGSVNVDDEGHPSQKNLLIENGILKGYMVDRFNGARMGAAATGSSRRQSYKFMPVSRMTNTYIAPGTDSRDDIIASTKFGIYAKYMGGGSVNPASGEFNFAVNEGYIIRDGKICEPVRGATLIGKGSQVLTDIDMVSSDLKLAEGMCGASSGSIPVCVGQPMIRVKEITVGGRG